MKTIDTYGTKDFGPSVGKGKGKKTINFKQRAKVKEKLDIEVERIGKMSLGARMNTRVRCAKCNTTVSKMARKEQRDKGIHKDMLCRYCWEVENEKDL